MFENLGKIENVITGIFTQISLNKLSNFHDFLNSATVSKNRLLDSKLLL